VQGTLEREQCHGDGRNSGHQEDPLIARQELGSGSDDAESERHDGSHFGRHPDFLALRSRLRDAHRDDDGELARGYDAVLIDAPPKNEDILRSAIAAASHVVVPVQPSGADLWPTRRVVDSINQARIFDESKKAAYCLTRVIAGTVIGREFAAEAETYGLPVLPAHTVQRVAYAEAMSAGLTVFEVDPTGPAAAEIRAILSAIKEL
jgi:chromosome partitioning protein